MAVVAQLLCADKNLYVRLRSSQSIEQSYLLGAWQPNNKSQEMDGTTVEDYRSHQLTEHGHVILLKRLREIEKGRTRESASAHLFLDDDNDEI